MKRVNKVLTRPVYVHEKTGDVPLGKGKTPGIAGYATLGKWRRPIDGATVVGYVKKSQKVRMNDEIAALLASLGYHLATDADIAAGTEKPKPKAAPKPKPKAKAKAKAKPKAKKK